MAKIKKIGVYEDLMGQLLMVETSKGVFSIVFPDSNNPHEVEVFEEYEGPVKGVDTIWRPVKPKKRNPYRDETLGRKVITTKHKTQFVVVEVAPGEWDYEHTGSPTVAPWALYGETEKPLVLREGRR